MSQFCSIATCRSKASSQCYCCNKNVCIDHLKEHIDLSNTELNCLNNEIISLNNQFKTVDMKKLVNEWRERFDQWKNDCHKIIDCYYEEKCKELETFCSEKVNQHLKEIDDIQTTITNLIQTEKTTQKHLDTLKSTIYDMKKDINKFKEKGIQIDIRPFLFDNHSITIKDTKPYAFNINPSKLSLSYHTIQSTNGSKSELISNDRFILINLGENLSLYDRDLALIKQTSGIAENIYDMCWSSSLANFIIITDKKKVYRINETTLSIDRVFGIEEKDWLSCTCSDTYLYLTTGQMSTNIYQFKFLPLIRPVKQWIPPYSCKPHQSIHHIQYNNRTLAVIVRDSFSGNVDIELCSTATFNRLWSLPLDIRSSGVWSRISCRALQYDEWLVIHAATSRLFHVTKDGQLKIVHEYHPKLNNAVMFGTNTLAIHLGSKVNFHHI